MKSDQDYSRKPTRRNSSVPVPGMPYGRHADSEPGASQAHRQRFEFIESKPVSEQRGASGKAFNPWEEQGWEAGDSASPTEAESDMLQDELYREPVYDMPNEYPDLYDVYEDNGEHQEYKNYGENVEYPAPELEEPVYPQAQLPPPPQPPKQTRKSEPWRTAVILGCIAGFLFCGVEIYRIAQNIVQSETEIREFREIYLKENNVDFMRNAQAVALRPPGETYPPTATPEPSQTNTPTPRIAQNDPLIAAMSSGGIDPAQSVAPSGPTPEIRSKLERYPSNPLLVIRDEISSLQVMNADIVGRLIINELLNEIVVLRNNTYYLNHNAMGVSAGYSAVFADENLSLRYPPENILLYGRISNEGKAFAPLINYTTQGREFVEQHAFLSFNSLYEEARYVIIAVIEADSSPVSPAYFDYQNLAFGSDADMMRFIEAAKDRSKYDFNVGIAPSDRLLTLVTLSEGTVSESIIIVCRMLREGESDGKVQPE